MQWTSIRFVYSCCSCLRPVTNSTTSSTRLFVYILPNIYFLNFTKWPSLSENSLKHPSHRWMGFGNPSTLRNPSPEPQTYPGFSSFQFFLAINLPPEDCPFHESYQRVPTESSSIMTPRHNYFRTLEQQPAFASTRPSSIQFLFLDFLPDFSRY